MKKTSRFTKFVSAGLTTVMLLFAVSTMNSVQVFAATTGTVNVSALNLRSGASTQTSVVSVLSSGTSVQIEETQGDWYKVTVSVSGATKSGYVYSKYINSSLLNKVIKELKFFKLPKSKSKSKVIAFNALVFPDAFAPKKQQPFKTLL